MNRLLLKTKQSFGYESNMGLSFERTIVVIVFFLESLLSNWLVKIFLEWKVWNPINQTGCLNFRRSLEFAPIVDLLPHLIRVQRVLESTPTKTAKENNSILVRAKKKGSDRKKCFIRGQMPVRWGRTSQRNNEQKGKTRNGCLATLMIQFFYFGP